MSPIAGREIEDLKEVRGVLFPGSLRLGQLVVTGPPGSGKSTLVRRIRGWPLEGYVSLGTRHWWRDQALAYRPREVHLALPFEGWKNDFTVFSDEWLENHEHLRLDIDRIQLPPAKRFFFSVDWYGRYVFEFLIPPPEKVFEAIGRRSEEGTHHMDREFRLEHVVRQAEIYREIGLHFDRSGFDVYLRDDYLGPPKRFVEVD